MRCRSIVLVAFLLPSVGRAETVYRVPVVAAIRSIEGGQSPTDVTVVTSWSSSTSLFNGGPGQGSFRYVGFLGGGASLSGEPYCSPAADHSIGPGAGQGLSHCVATPLAGSGVGFLLLETSGPISVHASISYLKQVCNCASLDCTPIPQGRSVLPVFPSVFPAGSVVVAGEVDLGRVPIPPGCGAAIERYPRRVNVTLLNEGVVPASFLVRVLPYKGGSEALLEQTVVVPARDVLQVNRLPLDLNAISVVEGSVAADGGVRVWVEISADQPFLAYASTVFDDGAPDSMPFEIYPPLTR